MEVGLLEVEPKRSSPNRFKLTERGEFYVREGLCRVPLPTYAFQIPWGNNGDRFNS